MNWCLTKNQAKPQPICGVFWRLRFFLLVIFNQYFYFHHRGFVSKKSQTQLICCLVQSDNKNPATHLKIHTALWLKTKQSERTLKKQLYFLTFPDVFISQLFFPIRISIVQSRILILKLYQPFTLQINCSSILKNFANSRIFIFKFPKFFSEQVRTIFETKYICTRSQLREVFSYRPYVLI